MQSLASVTVQLVLFLLQFHSFIKALPYIYSDHQCGSSNFSSGSEYQKNVNETLSSLAAAVPQKGYETTTTIGDASDIVYGEIQCRGYLYPPDCQTCANFISNEISQLCPYNNKAWVYNEDCELRYSNESFFASADADERMHLFNYEKADNPDLFNNLTEKLLRNLSSIAAASSPRLASGVTIYTDFLQIYAMAQCTPEISGRDCFFCLNGLISSLSRHKGSVGSNVFSFSCNIRYEIYNFFKSSSPPPYPPNTEVSVHNGERLKIVEIVVTSLAVALVLMLIICRCIIVWRRTKRERVDGAHDNSISMESLSIELKKLRAATQNFSEKCKLGEGGFGSVYKGKLPDGREIAVKRLSNRSNQGMEELKTEVMVVAKLQHRNLVKLLGFCLEEKEKLLVYEYLPNGSLDKVLFDKKKQLVLQWEKRYRIIVGIARGLLYLHEDSLLRIVHRDLKAGNILLDEHMNSKISDFGLAKLFSGSQTHGNTSRIAGTYGYMAPEYAKQGLFSTKSDVYSYGILVLEIVTGQKNSCFRNFVNLQSYVWAHWNDGTTLELLDPILKDQCPIPEVLKCIHIGLLCIQDSVAERPTMSEVVMMLNSHAIITSPTPLPPAFLVDERSSRQDPSLPTNETHPQELVKSRNLVSVTELLPR